MNEASAPSQMIFLPESTILKIFSYLDLRNAFVFSGTCKYLRELFMNDASVIYYHPKTKHEKIIKNKEKYRLVIQKIGRISFTYHFAYIENEIYFPNLKVYELIYTSDYGEYSKPKEFTKEQMEKENEYFQRSLTQANIQHIKRHTMALDNSNLINVKSLVIPGVSIIELSEKGKFILPPNLVSLDLTSHSRDGDKKETKLNIDYPKTLRDLTLFNRFHDELNLPNLESLSYNYSSRNTEPMIVIAKQSASGVYASDIFYEGLEVLNVNAFNQLSNQPCYLFTLGYTNLIKLKIDNAPWMLIYLFLI